jgi:hypothetical protein
LHKKSFTKRQQAKKLAVLLCLFFYTTRSTNIMKNKSFYFWWKIHASAASFSTKNKTFNYSNRFKSGRFRGWKKQGKSTIFKMTCSSSSLRSKELKYQVRWQKLVAKSVGRKA